MHDKLFREQIKIKEKKNIQSLEKMIKDSQVLTFQPYISPVSKELAKKSRSKSFNNNKLNKSADRINQTDKDKKNKKCEKNNIFLKNMQRVILKKCYKYLFICFLFIILLL